MTDWKAKTVDGHFAVLVRAPVLQTLERLCHAAGTSETGGILIGRYSDDRSVALVCEATPPPSDSRRGRSWFVRGVNGLRQMLGTKWRAEERTYYVGEWHFHPVDHVEPSPEDFSQMVEIGRTNEYDCKEPLMIILGTGRRDGFRGIRAYVCPVERSPLELVPERVGHSASVAISGLDENKS